MQEDVVASTWSNDIELLDLTQLTLQSAGFITTPISVSGLQAIRAEDLQRVIVAAAFVDIEDLVRAEGILAANIVDSVLSDSAESSRRWDGYLILLSTQEPDGSDKERIFNLTYNLRHIRRLVRIGVAPTPLGVARALRPILPLTLPEAELAASDPLQELEHALRSMGAEEQLLREQFTRFAQIHDRQNPPLDRIDVESTNEETGLGD